MDKTQKLLEEQISIIEQSTVSMRTQIDEALKYNDHNVFSPDLDRRLRNNTELLLKLIKDKRDSQVDLTNLTKEELHNLITNAELQLKQLDKVKTG